MYSQPTKLLSSAAIAAGIALFGGHVALAQETTTTYFGLEATKTSTSSAWELGYPVPEPDEIESTNATLVWLTGAPKLGTNGVTWGTRFTLQAGVEDSINDLGYFDNDGNGRYNADSDLQVDATYTYEEAARMIYTGVGYFSFAERFHPYVEAGIYYALGSEATMRGEVDGICRDTLHTDEVGTTSGFTYGLGMLVNIGEGFNLTLAYNVYDNVDFDFNGICLGDTYTLASLDSKVESVGLGVVYGF